MAVPPDLEFGDKLPSADYNNLLQAVRDLEAAGGGGSGDVTGPGSSAENAVALFVDGTGKEIKASGLKVIGSLGLYAIRTDPAIASSQLDLDPMEGTGSSAAVVRIGRNTATTDGVRLQVLRGDNPASQLMNHELRGVGNSVLAVNNGNIGVGGNPGAYKLDVTGTVRVTQRISAQGLLLSSGFTLANEGEIAYNHSLHGLYFRDNVGNKGIAWWGPSSDLNGDDPYGQCKVKGIQGVSIASTTPTDGQVLAYSSVTGEWQPETPSAGGSTNWGDISGTLAEQTDLQAALDAKLESVAIADIESTGTPDSSTYLRGDGTWSTPAGGSYDPLDQSHMYLRDEFTNRYTSGTYTIGNLGWSCGNNSSVLITGEPGHPGIIRLTTTATDNNDTYATLSGSASTVLIDYQDLISVAGWRFRFIARPNDSLGRYGIGLMKINYGNAEGFTVSYDSDVDTNWQFTHGPGSGNTYVDSGVPFVSGEWITIEIWSDSIGTVKMSINGTVSSDITSNFPDQDLAPGFYVQTREAAAKTIDLNFFACALPIDR